MKIEVVKAVKSPRVFSIAADLGDGKYYRLWWRSLSLYGQRRGERFYFLDGVNPLGRGDHWNGLTDVVGVAEIQITEVLFEEVKQL